MQKSVVILSMTTLGFASSTLYLAYELYSRDAAPAAVHIAAVEDRRQQSGRARTAWPRTRRRIARRLVKPSHPGHGAASTAPSSPAAAPDVPDSATTNETNEGTLMWARPFLARFDDSAQHGEMLNEAKTGIRRQYSRLKEQLKLSDAGSSSWSRSWRKKCFRRRSNTRDAR